MIEEQYVDIRNKEERKDFIENLETKGYKIDKIFFDRNNIINGIFPLIIDLTNKKINMMGNVTTSAAAISSGVLISNEIEIYNIVKEVSSITHAHEISVLGCYIYTRYCLLLLEGNDKFEAYKKLQQLNYSIFSENTLNKYERILKEDISPKSEDDISSSGYVVSTLEAVMWLFLNSKDYNSTILKAVNLGNDTDTIAAITGSLLGIYYGLNSIKDKWKLSLKKHDYIIDLCKKFEEML